MKKFQTSLQLLRANLPNMLCIILLLALVLVFYVARVLIEEHEKHNEELLQELRTALSSHRITEDKNHALKRELTITKAELASLTKKHQQEQTNAAKLQARIKNTNTELVDIKAELACQQEQLSNTATLEKKLEGSGKTVRLLAQSNRQTRILAHDLIAQKVSLNGQIVGYHAQLRSARADLSSQVDMVRKLQERFGKVEQENTTLRHERTHLTSQLASEMEDGMQLTQQIKYKANELCALTAQLESARSQVEDLDRSNEKGWAEVKAWRADPLRMVRKAEEWKRLLRGVPLLGKERDRELCWDGWWRMGEKSMERKDVVLDLEEESEERAGDDEEELEGEVDRDEDWQDDASWVMEGDESGETVEWTEVSDGEWEEVEDEEDGIW